MRNALFALCYQLPKLGGLRISMEEAMGLDVDEFLDYHRRQRQTQKEIVTAMKKAARGK